MKNDVKAYYGDYLDASGKHHFSDSSRFVTETKRVVADAKRYLTQKLGVVKNLANEGYPAPAEAFFKPSRIAPDYLPCGLTCTTVQYKSGTRAHIQATGAHIVLNLGDQFNDLEGGYADNPVKLPNPMYYLP